MTKCGRKLFMNEYLPLDELVERSGYHPTIVQVGYYQSWEKGKYRRAIVHHDEVVDKYRVIKYYKLTKKR